MSVRTDGPGLLLTVLIVCDFLYTAGFAHIPLQIRLPAAGVLFVVQALLGLVAVCLRPNRWLVRYVALVLMLPLCWLVSAAFVGESANATQGLRFAGPFLAGVLFLAYRNRLPLELIFWFAAGTIFFALGWALVSPAFAMGGIDRFAPFQIPYGVDRETAGQTVHPSANAVVVCLILAHQALLSGAGRRIVFMAVAAASVGLVVGYFSTQAQLSILVYFGAHLLVSAGRRHQALRFLILVLVVVGAGAVVVEKELRNAERREAVHLETEDLGTGRLGLWHERVEIIRGYGPLEILIGRGVGYDVVLKDEIAPTAVVAHNPYLTYVAESGLVGLAIFLALLFSPLLFLPRSIQPVLAVVLVTTLVGNGLPLRGMTFVLTWLAIAVAARRSRRVGSPHKPGTRMWSQSPPIDVPKRSLSGGLGQKGYGTPSLVTPNRDRNR